MRLLFISHTPIGGAFVVGSHHLARELAVRGHEVFHVSTPVSTAHAVLRKGPVHKRSLAKLGWQTTEDGVRHLVPRSLLPAGWGPDGYLRGALEQIGAVDVILLDQPKMFGRALRDARIPVVYRPTDVYLKGTARRRQSGAVRHAIGVVATSNVVLETLHLEGSSPNLVLTNGVDLERFSVHSDGGRNGFVYIGALDDRFDWKAIRAMAEVAPNSTFDIYGPLTRRVGEMPRNVSLRGAISYKEVPAILNSASVGLLPFSAAPENEGRSPMKLYEYLACGLHVLASRSAAVDCEVPFGVRVYHNDATLRDAVHELSLVDSINAVGVSRAAEMGWDDRATQLEAFVQEHA